MVVSFIRSFKEECAWQHNFNSIEEARRTITRWVDWYNDDRPHQSLQYQTPNQYGASFNVKLAA